jgi:uncharacterized membrane protein YdjX (TVP38/TMEM64 family)
VAVEVVTSHTADADHTDANFVHSDFLFILRLSPKFPYIRIPYRAGKFKIYFDFFAKSAQEGAVRIARRKRGG